LFNFFAGCLHHQLLLADGNEQAFTHHTDDTELDDTELSGWYG